MERCIIVALFAAGLSAVDAARLNHRSACGVKGGSNSSIISTGADALECEWRWQVALWEDRDPAPTCAGVLIAMDWVLTSADCAWGKFPTFNAVAGITDIHDRDHRQSRKVVQQFVHPQYKGAFDFDLALLRLETPMVSDGCVGTICLPTTGADVAPGSTCWITGWDWMTGRDADVLQEFQVNIMTREVCSAVVNGGIQEGWGTSTASTVCAWDGDKPCLGDAGAGGPLVCESAGGWTVYGANSQACLWARVHDAIGWIDETLAANTGPPPPIETCPDFAYYSAIDKGGMCECPPGQFCSRNGFDANCSPPWFPAFRPQIFDWDCSDCQCYPEM